MELRTQEALPRIVRGQAVPAHHSAVLAQPLCSMASASPAGQPGHAPVYASTATMALVPLGNSSMQ